MLPGSRTDDDGDTLVASVVALQLLASGSDDDTRPAERFSRPLLFAAVPRGLANRPELLAIIVSQQASHRHRRVMEMKFPTRAVHFMTAVWVCARAYPRDTRERYSTDKPLDQ